MRRAIVSTSPEELSTASVAVVGLSPFVSGITGVLGRYTNEAPGGASFRVVNNGN